MVSARAPVAQRTEQEPSKLLAGGSNPPGGAGEVPLHGDRSSVRLERQVVALEDGGSSPLGRPHISRDEVLDESKTYLVKTGAAFADIGAFEKMVSFEISSVDLNHAMNRASRKISREVNFPGFRPGRAPRRLVERRVGAERLRADALDDLVPARMGAILAQSEIAPVVPPLLESVTDAENGAVKVEVRVTTWPRLEAMPDYRGKQIQVQAPPPVAEEVDARLTQLRHMYAPLQTVQRPVEEGDFVIIDMTVKEGERLIESLALDGFSYEVGSERLTPHIDEGLLGRQAGEEIQIRAPTASMALSRSPTRGWICGGG